MRAFIVQPFAARQSIDFNRVQAELITPALEKRGIAGDTTQQFCEAGNIRIDMFEQLLLADVVVADISVHNANVFYELGIRHALRAKHTVLIRAKVTKPRPERTGGEVPFDLKTDRYPSTITRRRPPRSMSREGSTFAADARKDSPVFGHPSPGEQTTAGAAPGSSPRRWTARRVGTTPVLGLLAAEASGATWEVEGWRKVAKRCSTSATPAHDEPGSAFGPSRTRHANLRLATILQKAGAITESDQALDRVFKHRRGEPPDKAEGWALRGSNESGRDPRPLRPRRTPTARARSLFLEKAYRATGPPSIST